VTPQEFDQYLEDLEVRLERLRSLYEQYFMGMERIEPLVARKDVDRRFWTLRREKVHNTARRFRLQMLVQRYNTLQQYWQRTCREIENGTYRRHKLKAERTIPLASETQAEASASSTPPVAERSQQAVRSAEEDLRALLASDFDPAAEVEAALDAIFGSPAPVPAAPASPPAQANPAAPAPQPAAPPLRSPPPRPATGSAPAGPPRPPPAPSQRPVKAGPPLPPPRGVSGPPAPPPAGRSLPPRPPPRPAASARPNADGALPRPAPPPPPSAAQRAEADRGRGTGAPAAGSGLSDARIRELHARYLASRQGSHAPPVSLEKLAQSLRTTEAKLRQQHQGHRIDFDVVVKDGKPVIKPKISR